MTHLTRAISAVCVTFLIAACSDNGGVASPSASPGTGGNGGVGATAQLVLLVPSDRLTDLLST